MVDRQHNAEPQIDIDCLFHALGDPTRRAIVDRLAQGPASVSQLAGPLGVTITAVMQHLQILQAAGLAHTEKMGRVRTCQLGTAGLATLENWIREHRNIWDERMDRLTEVLQEGPGPGPD